MMPRTVEWSTGAPANPPAKEGLRQRKKRLVRQQLSDTATEMFVERGFDNVRITEIAEACGVSEKTVYNYFPIKESLILDRWESTPGALLRALADPALTPIDAALRVLDDELTSLTSWLAGLADPVEAIAKMRRFGDLIQETPSLRAYARDMTDQLVAQAAEVLAARMGLDPPDPEPQIAAATILELWTIQAGSLRRRLETTLTPAQRHEMVTADVQRAARLIAAGLASFDTLTRRQSTPPATAPIAATRRPLGHERHQAAAVHQDEPRRRRADAEYVAAPQW
jgi:AcrR family transcriptional regulator